MHMLNRFRLNRRTFLRGLGAALALPPLEAMFNNNGDAHADGSLLPRRFGVFFFGNGVRLSRWIPQTRGAAWSLSDELAPLASVKDYVNVVTGYNANVACCRGHHGGETAVLSGRTLIELPHAEGSYASKFGGPSIDQLIAEQIGNDTLFRSVELGVSKRVTTSEGPTLQFISHKGPDQPLPPEYSPARLYVRLFDSFSTNPQEDPRQQMRANVLDRVHEDAQKLSRKLGSSDKARLDAHLTSISELRQRILSSSLPVTSACIQPDQPASANLDVNGIEPLTEVSQAMAELTALAFACDLTRVVSTMFSGSVGGTVYAPVGATSEMHGLTHDPNQQELVHQCVVYIVSQYAYLLEKLRDMHEGAGNVLDNSCILFTSDCAEGLTHSNNDYPLLVGGRGGGVLRYPGVHHRGDGENTSDVLVSCLRACNISSPFGAGEGFSNTPCQEILG